MLFTIPPEIREKLGTFPELSSSEYEQLRCSWGNAAAGSLRGLDCPVCRNKGYILTTDANGAQNCVECACMKKRRSLRLIENSGLADALTRYTFDSFETPEPWQKEMKERALAFLAEGGGAWFMAAGAVGSGKSHICTALCGALLDAGLEVRYMLWRDESARLKALVNDAEAYGRAVEPLKTARVLYIDDFLKTQTGREVTAADVNLAFEILNARYLNSRLTTVLSAEKSVEDILNIDEAVGSRIFERCRGYYVYLSGGGKNWRLRPSQDERIEPDGSRAHF